jgi:glycosyl transferase, family 25
MRLMFINLAREPERRFHMEAMIKREGLSFERIDAVDGRALTEREIARWRHDAPSFYRLRSGEVACFLSHRKCWEIIASGAEPAAVLEDDISFGRGAADILGRSDWVPKDADLVKLDTTLMRTFIDPTPLSAVEGRALSWLRSHHHSASAYVLSPSAAATLLGLTERFADSVDDFLYHPRGKGFQALRIAQMCPALCIQNQNLDAPDVRQFHSELAVERRANKRRGMAKLGRELIRPFRQVSGYCYGWARSLVRGERWGRIPFE